MVGSNASRRAPGDVAGAPRSATSYVQIGIDGKRYYAHRLAWFYIYGVWPGKIDHRDLNKQNNIFSNLREATTSQNGANSFVRVDSNTRVKGVRKNKNCATYSARLGTTHLGCFATAEEAHMSYIKAAKKKYGVFAHA